MTMSKSREVNPETVCYYRKQLRMTQEELAEKSKLGRKTIQRYESKGERQTPNATSLNKLSEALQVRPEDLMKPPPKKGIEQFLNRVPLKTDIAGSARTFLTLVQGHFRLTEDAIMDLAPLAVLILGKRSLHVRQTALNETVEALEAATAEACRRLPYMPGAFRDGYDYEWLDEERKSLDKNELFMTHQDFEGNEYSPFINFLQDELKALDLFQKPTPIELTASYRGATPDYAVPTHVLGANVGLDPDNEADQSILERIQDGQIDLREVMEKKKAAEAEEYRRWLEEKNRAITEEIDARVLRVDIKIKLPGDQSTPAATGSTTNKGADIDNTNTGERT